MFHRPIALLLLLLCGGAASFAVSPPAGPEFAAAVHDFGRIDQRDGSVSCTFRFTNRSAEPLVIERVSASCGCVASDYDRRPVLPGGEAAIRVTFDPAGRSGAFEKSLYVSFSGGAGRSLTLRGTVSADASPRFPAGGDGGIRLSSCSADLGMIPCNGRAEHLFLLHNDSPQARNVAIRSSRPSHLLVLASPRRIAPGATDTLRVCYDLRREPLWGTLCDSLFLSVEGRPAATLSVLALAVDPPADADARPEVRVDRRNILLSAPAGSMHRGVCHTFVLHNGGTAPLHVRKAECRGGAHLAADPAGAVVAPQDSLPLCVGLLPDRYRAGVVTLFTDDPAEPVLRLYVRLGNRSV